MTYPAAALSPITSPTIAETGFIAISEAEVRSTARQMAAYDAPFLLFFRRFYNECHLRLRKHVNFRITENSKAVRAYSAMSIPEFAEINALQSWSNWRTVPRNLSGRVPARPLRALDLCCGTGDSSAVLAHYLPQGSTILGLEYNPEFVKTARTRQFKDKHGALVRTEFHSQSVLEPFCDSEQRRLADASIDLVNVCGAVAHHFDPRATQKLLREVARVLRPGGLAMIDAGSRGTPPGVLKTLLEESDFEVIHEAQSHSLDPYRQLCARKL